MIEQKYSIRLFFIVSTCVLFSTASVPAFSYEEPIYKVISKTDAYEIRRYEKRTVAQVNYDQGDSGFRLLFDYISGKNNGSKEVEMTIPVIQSNEIDMTVPVTQSNTHGKMIMQFFLPKEFSKHNAPEPTDSRVSIIDLPEEYFAVISYSGFASDSNFNKHNEELSIALENDGVSVIGSPIKATYNSPFTPPFLRRNEAMYPIKWQ